MPDPDQPASNASFGIYNPGSLAPEVLLDEFIARKHQLATALDIVRHNKAGEPAQHLLVLGPRGMGKTMFLLALAYQVERDSELSPHWLPVIFPEETYNIGDLADFWIAAATQLLQTLHRDRDIDAVEALRDANPEDIEDQARALFLRHLDATGKRVLLVLENLHDFFDSVSEEAEQHRLRAFLMEDDRVMIAASSPSYFDATGQMDQPFYDFFRHIRLERFDRTEMIEVLTHLAKLRNDPNVQKVIDTQPDRITSLHVLTGGNPRLIKMIYRLLSDGGTRSARADLDRLLEDCTPYFKHRIEELSREERRVFDHVARHWDPVAVGDIQKALRRPSNKVSTYLRRLVNEGFIEEAEGSTSKRKAYQVAERFYNIYYLMRFTRAGKRRLSWLIKAMQALYSATDFEHWTRQTLDDWKQSKDPTIREDREAFLYSLTQASECVGLQKKLVDQSIAAAWEKDQLESLDRILDRELAEKALGTDFELIDFFAHLPSDVKKEINYDPTSAGWWHLLSLVLFTQGRYDLAERACKNSLRINPEDPAQWSKLGYLYQEMLHRLDEAENAYRKCIELHPECSAVWNNLGNLLSGQEGRYDEAEQIYRQAALADPSDPNPWNGIGNLFAKTLERYEDAKDAYRKAIQIDPLNPHSWNNVANVYRVHDKNHELAEEAYKEAIRIDPELAQTWNNLGLLYGEDLNLPEQEEQAYRKAISIDPNYAHPYAGLSDHYSRQNHPKRACEMATKSVSLGPQISWPRRQFLKLCGENPDAWQAILPALLSHLAAESFDDETFEFTLQGITFLLSQDQLTAAEVIDTIRKHDAEEPLEDVLLALSSLDDPTVLTKASPERRAFARDFIARITPSPPDEQ